MLEEALIVDRKKREAKWSKAIAVGSASYMEKIKKQLGMKAVHRKASRVGDGFELREEDVPYNADFAPESERLRSNNSLLWELSYKKTVGCGGPTQIQTFIWPSVVKLINHLRENRGRPC
jgi:hypothetical protein